MNTSNILGNSFLDQLAVKTNFKSKRISSWDTTGKNRDAISLNAKEKVTLAKIDGPGAIKHIYSTSVSFDPFFYRNVIIKMYWDGEENPSVEVPLGDFFGIGHCKPKLFNSLLLSVNPGNAFIFDSNNNYNYGINCYFPMPFAESAVIELENQSDIPVPAFWFHIDYQQYPEINKNLYRFHAQWNREITKAREEAANNKGLIEYNGVNLDGKENYTILEATGNGQLAGILLNVDNISGGWWGEGDDMVFIDGESWPPSLHGTGTEEIFGGGACPGREYSTPYCGFHLISNFKWYRHSSMYRFFIPDPIRFNKSIRYTIEHGHANNFENDYSSVAYWYQDEPHKKFKIQPASDRVPVLLTEEEKVIAKKHLAFAEKMSDKGIVEKLGIDTCFLLINKMSSAEKASFDGKHDQSLSEWQEIEKLLGLKII